MAILLEGNLAQKNLLLRGFRHSFHILKLDLILV